MSLRLMLRSLLVKSQRTTSSGAKSPNNLPNRDSRRFMAGLAIFVGLSGLWVGQAAADCPDVPISCDYGAVGWQGQCYSFPVCQDCGPAQCPHVLPDYRFLPFLIDESKCPEAKTRASDGCSNPSSDPASAVYNDVFKIACDAHDVCYSSKGVPKVLCDINFYQNMSFICRDFYKGVVNTAQRFSCLAAAGIYADAVSLTPQGAQAYSDDQDWANKCCAVHGTVKDCPGYKKP